MKLNVEKEVAALQRLTANELRERFAELFGETTNARNKVWLVRRIAWRLQAKAEGGLTERALKRAAELADEADLRVTPPKDDAKANLSVVPLPGGPRPPPPTPGHGPHPVLQGRQRPGHRPRSRVRVRGRGVPVPLRRRQGGHRHPHQRVPVLPPDREAGCGMKRKVAATAPADAPVRCGVYTRKSSDEGLDK